MVLKISKREWFSEAKPVYLNNIGMNEYENESLQSSPNLNLRA